MAGIADVPELVVGIAAGAAASTALEPALEIPRQDAWDGARNKILEPELLARLVAQGGVTLDTAHYFAHRNGFDDDQFAALVYMAQTVPDLALTLEVWRRGLLGDPQSTAAIALVEHAFVKHQIEPQYWPALEELFSGRLDPALIATMVQRSVLPNATNPASGEQLLPFNTADVAQTVYDDWAAVVNGLGGIAPPTGHNVTPMPQVELDPITEARAHGIDFDRLAAETRIVGLPASPDLAARAVFRRIITAQDFVQALAEGNARVEWAPALFEAFREIPTVRDFVQKHLRGWTDAQGMYDGAARHGMGKDDVDTLFQIERRPLSPHQIKQGLARGARFNPAPNEIQDPYTASVHQNNLGPEWYELAVSLQGAYPSLFITNRLVTGGTISADTGRDWLQKSGNADEVVTAMHDSWTGGGTVKADPALKSEQTRLKTATHKAYIDFLIPDSTATTALEAAGVSAAAVPAVLQLWQAERDLIRKSLSAAQIKKAWTEQIPDPATGQPWTEAEAVTRLQELGYTADDAKILLVE